MHGSLAPTNFLASLPHDLGVCDGMTHTPRLLEACRAFARAAYSPDRTATWHEQDLHMVDLLGWERPD